MRDCTAESVELTPKEMRRLEELPDAAHEVTSSLDCEVEDGHAGPHWALAQAEDRGADGTKNWWLRWTEDSREWAHNPTCYSENDDASELCLLPSGHEGVHSWA